MQIPDLDKLDQKFDDFAYKVAEKVTFSRVTKAVVAFGLSYIGAGLCGAASMAARQFEAFKQYGATFDNPDSFVDFHRAIGSQYIRCGDTFRAPFHSAARAVDFLPGLHDTLWGIGNFYGHAASSAALHTAPVMTAVLPKVYPVFHACGLM